MISTMKSSQVQSTKCCWFFEPVHLSHYQT